MTPAQTEEIKRRAMTDARALQCGYPKRDIPYSGESLKLYEQFYAKAQEAYGVKR